VSLAEMKQLQMVLHQPVDVRPDLA
jgi:hypothetical protein